MFRRFSLFSALAVLSLAASACGRSDDAPQSAASGEPPAAASPQPPAQADPAKGVVNLYTARHYDADRLLYDGFTRATGIKVNRIETRPDLLIERMRAEGASSPADVILMADAGALWKAEAAGLLQPVSTPLLEERIPATLRDDEKRWWGFARRARVVAYDKAKVRPEEVATYEALASPRFKGRVCVRSSDNVYNQSLLAALIERWGPEKARQWSAGVAANMARPPQGGDRDQIRAVAAGACEVALTNSYYFIRMANDGGEDAAQVQGLGLAFPQLAGGGTHVNISGAGVAANAPNKANAIRFLEYLASDEAQAILASANYEFPAVATVKPPEAVAAYAGFTPDPTPVSVYGERQAEAQRIFDQTGWR